MNKIAACLISGDSWNEEEVKTLLTSIEPWVHGIFIAYNGDKKILPWQQYTSTKIVQKKFKWEDDFGLARDQSFSLVPRDKYDYYLWIDTDDVFRVHEDFSDPLEEMFDSLDEYTKGIFIKYNYAIEPDTGIVVVEQWRERFLSTELEWRWKWPIHEVCAPPIATQIARREHCWIDHQRSSGDDRGARERNRRILTKAATEEPEESRHIFYLAGETMAEADAEKEGPRKKELIEAAIEIYNNFRIMRNSLDEDVYLATARMAELNRMKGDYSSALSCDMEAIAMYPDWPDGFVGAAKSCMEITDWRRMKAFADMATRIPKPATAVSIESLNSSFTPLFLRGFANENLGEREQALADYREAQKYWNPPNGQLNDKIDALMNNQNNNSVALEDVRKRYRGTREEKSICFYTNRLIETWHPETLKKGGHGGAETCIIELAPRFVAEGWRVAVFGTPGEHRGVHDGVEYWDSEEWLAQEPFTVFVSSRSPLPFESQINAKVKLLWMHDVNLSEHLYRYKDEPDRIIALSQWHKGHLANLYDIPESKFSILGNGIDISRFELDRSQDDDNAPKFIWLSSPDRGLDVLLSLWPLILQRYPGATVEIYYGWALIEKIIENYRSHGQTHGVLENLKVRVENQIRVLGGEKSGIIWKGRVPPDELAEALYRANFWAYPTDFLETFCISAIQAQAAGVIPITSYLGALKENIAFKRNMVEGWPSNVTYQREFLGVLDDIITNEPLGDVLRRDARKKGRQLAESYTWDKVFERWLNLFEDLGVIIPSKQVELVNAQ